MRVGPERPPARTVDTAGVGGEGLRGQHHRPLGVPPLCDLLLGVRHLVAGAAQMQRGGICQSRIGPRNVLGENEIHLGHAGSVPVALKCAGVARRQRVTVNVEQCSGRGVVEHDAAGRRGHFGVGVQDAAMGA